MGRIWHYAKGNQQHGPITEEQLLHLAQTGEISGDDQVWTEGMPHWLPARTAPLLQRLFGAPAAIGHPPAPTVIPAQNVAAAAGVLQYSAPSLEGFTVSQRSLEMLRQTRPWVRLISILLMVFAGLVVLVGIAVFGIGALRGSVAAARGGPPAFLGAIYVAMALLYVAPAIYLSRYASRINSLLLLRRSDLLDAALEAQKSFWKFVGVFALVILSFCALGLIIGIIVLVLR